MQVAEAVEQCMEPMAVVVQAAVVAQVILGVQAAQTQAVVEAVEIFNRLHTIMPAVLADPALLLSDI
jgi:hypothetical protein